MGELSGPSEPPPTFEGALNQNAWAQAHVHQHPHLGPTLRSMHRWCIGLAVLLGAKPNYVGQPPEGPFPSVLAPQHWGWGPRAQGLDSPCCPSATRGARGPASHSERENGQVPPGPRRPLNSPLTKTLLLMLSLASALTSSQSSACHTASDRVHRPPGDNHNPTSIPKAPLPRGLAPQRRGLGTPNLST